MQTANLVDGDAVEGHVLLTEEGIETFLALLLGGTLLAPQGGENLALGLGRRDKRKPLGIDALGARGEHLYLVAAA